jgi:gliding motility-associated-like protein
MTGERSTNLDKIVCTVFFYFFSIGLFAQRPVITSLEPAIGYPTNTIVITGSGFGNTAANLQVWFGQVKGSVITATDVSVTATIPPQARLHNVEVINVSSNLSAKSMLKFTPAFNGEGFAPSKLTAPLSFASTAAVFDLCSCDLDNDSKPDLIGTKFENTGTDLILLQNQSTPGSLSFIKLDKSNLPALNIGAPTGNVTCGDLNGDGKPDLVASRSGATANSIFVLRNTSAGTPNFATPLELFLDVGHFARETSVHDLNGDGKPEIIVANSFNNILYVFQNQSAAGVLSINPNPLKITMSGVPNSLALEVQDLNGDFKPDIVVTQNQGPNIYVLKNQSSSTIAFAAPAAFTIPGAFNDINSADFNSDGKLDFVLTSVFNAQALVVLNQSTPAAFSFAINNTLTTGNGPFGVDVSDINGDGFPDIIVPNRGVGAIDVFLHNKNVSPGFSKTTIATAKTNWYTKVGDLDGDAKPDIAFTSFNNATFNFSIEVLRNRNCYEPKILNVPPLAICTGQTVTLEAIPALNVSFEWKNGATSIKNSQDEFVDITTAGTYTVMATGEAGACVIASSPIVVSAGAGAVPATPSINVITPVCAGTTLNVVAPTLAGATYLWEGPGGFTVSETDPTLSIPNATAAHSGQYTLRVKVGDCTSSADVETGQVIDLGSFTISNNAPGQLCAGQTATLSANLVAGHTYQWIRNGADIGGQTASTFTAAQDGVYKVRVTFSGCSVETADANVIIVAKPIAGFTNTNAGCIGETIEFANTSTSDSRATVVYSWNFDDGETSSSVDATHNYSVVGAYAPSLTVSYSGVASCAATHTGSVSISDASPPKIISEATEICAGEKTMLSIEGPYTTITWSNNETSAFIIVEDPATYTVTTEDANGCAGADEIILASKSGCGSVDIEIPLMFSPNEDARNDRWIIGGIENYSECTMNIYDDKGVGIYQQTGYPSEGWDGVGRSGRQVPDGVYYYILGCPDRTPVTGAVTILR